MVKGTGSPPGLGTCGDPAGEPPTRRRSALDPSVQGNLLLYEREGILLAWEQVAFHKGMDSEQPGALGSAPSSHPPRLGQSSCRPWRHGCCVGGGLALRGMTAGGAVRGGGQGGNRSRGRRAQVVGAVMQGALHERPPGRSRMGAPRQGACPRAHGQLVGQVCRPPGSGPTVLLLGGQTVSTSRAVRTGWGV